MGMVRRKLLTIKTLQREALRIVEGNLIKGIWTVETAQFWLTRVEQQPENVVKAFRKEKKLMARKISKDLPTTYNDWPHVGWWKTKEEYAKRMTVDELWFARMDCNDAAIVLPQVEGKYRDEGTI